MSFRWLSSVSCVGACFIMGLAACGGADSDGGNLGPDATGFAPARDAALPNVALRSIDTRIVRAIALALADSGIRTQVYRALHDSPFKDHKLQFSRYLHAGGSQLLAGAAAASGLDPASFLAAVDSLPQLEFYLACPGASSSVDRWYRSDRRGGAQSPRDTDRVRSGRPASYGNVFYHATGGPHARHRARGDKFRSRPGLLSGL